MSATDLEILEAIFQISQSGSMSGIGRASSCDEISARLSARAGSETGSVTAIAGRALAGVYACLADLERWESSIATAEQDADRHRRAAAHRARTLFETLQAEDPVISPIAQLLSRMTEIEDPMQVADLRAAAVRLPPGPLPLIDRSPREPGPARPKSSAEEPSSRAALIVSIDDSPITWAHGLAPGRVHALEVEARVLDWPIEAQELTVRFLSRWPKSAVEVTDIVLARPEHDVGEVAVSRGTGHLALHASAADPTQPVALTLEAQLSGDGQGRSPMQLLGLRELAFRTFDPSKDIITGAPALDERILKMLYELHETNVPRDERAAFARFFGAIARAGVRIMADRDFPPGSSPSEKDFQDALRMRLGMATELGGRVVEHAWQGGGPTDLQHDGIVAELKVERNHAATLETARRYMAQATQYASAGQRQLSVLVVLDMTAKEAPPGVLANTIGWLTPALHGLSDPAFPSRVGVVIVNGNLPLPSSWSR